MITTLCWVVACWCCGFGRAKGHASTWALFEGVLNIDHTSEVVANDLKNWLLWVCTEVGFTCFCFDYARGWGNGHLCFKKRAYVCVCTHFFLGHNTCVAKTTMPFLQQSFEILIIYIQYPVFPSWRYNAKLWRRIWKHQNLGWQLGNIGPHVNMWARCMFWILIKVIVIDIDLFDNFR